MDAVKNSLRHPQRPVCVTGYIAACSSDLGREVDPESWRITGGRTHVARITRSGGFEWVIAPVVKAQEKSGE